MRKFITVLLLVLITSGVEHTYAQHRIAKTTSLGVSGGLTSRGWNISFDSEFIFTDPQHSLICDLRYFDMAYDTGIKEAMLPVRDYILSINYAFNFCNYINAPINIGLSAGVSLGYEDFAKQLGDNGEIHINQTPGIMYGLNAGVQFEIYIVRGFSAFISPKLFYFIDAPTRQVNFTANAGVRVVF